MNKSADLIIILIESFMKELEEANNWKCRIKNKSPALLYCEKPYSVVEVIFKSRESRDLFFCPLRVMAKFSNELIATSRKLTSWNVQTSNTLLVFIVHDRWKLAPASQQYCQFILDDYWERMTCCRYIYHLSVFCNMKVILWVIISTICNKICVVDKKVLYGKWDTSKSFFVSKF